MAFLPFQRLFESKKTATLPQEWLFFVCFNRPSRHDQSAFSGDRMPGHAEACHPNGPYDGVRVEACVDHRSSRRSNHLGSCRQPVTAAS